MNVVFTGPATDKSGAAVLRADLINACEATGQMTVQKAVGKTTQLLVASRFDTRKAQAASSRGIEVLTYAQFFDRFLRGRSIDRIGTFDRFTDTKISQPKEKPAEKQLTLDLVDYF